MNKNYLLFRYKEVSLGEVAASLEKKIDVKFSEHESFFKGGVYYRYDYLDRESIIIQRNLELDGELAEEEFPAYPSLIYVDSSHRPDYWKGVIFGTAHRAKLLRQEEFGHSA